MTAERPINDADRAKIRADLLKHYSALRFVILPLFGSAVGAPVVLATAYPEAPRFPLILASVGAGLVFLALLIRAQQIIDALSYDLHQLVLTPHDNRWGFCFKLLTLIGCVVAVIAAVWVISGTPDAA